MSTASPEVAALLAWSEQFAAGLIRDPDEADGLLLPGERVAVRAAPISAVGLEVHREGPVVTGVRATGAMVATDRRVLLSVEGDATLEWSWASDVGRVTPLRNYLGAMWTPSDARYQAGVRLEGLVVPGFAAGSEPPPVADAAGRGVWVKVQVAWRASQPGGIEAWRSEFRGRYGG